MKTKTNVVSVEVTKAIFDKAAKKMNSSESYVAEDCLVAQAVRPSFPRRKIHVSYEEVEVSTYESALNFSMRTFSLSKNAQRLIHRFDACYFEPENPQYKRLRASLPVTIKLTEKVSEEAS